MDQSYLPKILWDPELQELVIVPATLLGSSPTSRLQDVGDERASELARSAAAGGGLWVVQGRRFARVLTAAEYVDWDGDYLSERQAPALFDGGPPRGRLPAGPVDLVVPVDGWEPGRSYYFHSESPFFASVPVVRKRNHRLEQRRGELTADVRKLVKRRVVEGQTCGVITNELGGLCVVPDGEVATDVRAVYADRFRFIVDGIRDLGHAARVLHQYADRFEEAGRNGWVLARPIDNSFLYAVNRRRLRTLLPLPAPGALVPVGVPVSLPLEPGAGALVSPASAERVDAVLAGRIDAGHGFPDAETIAALAATAVAELERSDDAPAGPADPAGSAEPVPTVDDAVTLAQRLSERFAQQLLDAATEPLVPADRPPTRDDSIPVLRRSVFRKPRGTLLRQDTANPMVLALLNGQGSTYDVVRGQLPDDARAALNVTFEDQPDLFGSFGLCTGAFGYVLAELGSPLRAVQSMSSSVSYAHLLDGVERPDEAAVRLRAVAYRLDALDTQGWTLSQPIAGFWLRLRSPLRSADV